ncbi:DEAH4 [Scenedesmus sp. PABB004]|nr:DEAH4 [Scenedesmus sp. PABB004]
MRLGGARRLGVQFRATERVAHCLPARQRPLQRAAGRRSAPAAAAGSDGADAGLDADALAALKEAFGAAPPRPPPPQQPAGGGAAPSFAAPSDRASRAGGRRDGRPAAAAGGRGGKPAGSGSAVAAAAAAAAASAPPAAAAKDKKRRGPFADLMASLEHDMLSPPGPQSSSSSSSSSSGGGGGGGGGGADGAAAPRKLTRRIRQQPAAAEQQLQHAPPPPPLQPEQPPAPWMLDEAAAVASGAVAKAHRPVFKGDLALPGGPAWSALRRHVVAAGDAPGLPRLSCVVLVEGDQDQKAVARAVNAPVYVCDGTRVLKPHVAAELSMLTRLGRPLVVLTDPDERGRELRLHLEGAIGPLGHAFVPEPAASAAADGPVHAAGNRGIEHVVPLGVQAALARARPAHPPGRDAWSLERLQAARLANAFDGGAERSAGAAARRRALCAALGLGRCSAAQLVAMLNRFFDDAEVEAALAALDAVEAEAGGPGAAAASHTHTPAVPVPGPGPGPRAAPTMDTAALPIRQHAAEILAAVEKHDVVVVIGETGSGKTTQLSQILMEAGYADHGMIGVTQPRRVGAVTVARRVAEERRCELGREVGYAVRFENRTSPATRIKYLTDGTLLQECLEDTHLSKYEVIILDEAHERSLNTDILFGVIKQLLASQAGARRRPLKLLVTSATLDGEKFSAYFNDCPVFNVPGRCFPVDVIHSTEDHLQDYASAAVDAALQIHLHQPPGDILVFLTGQAEIDKAVARLNKEARGAARGARPRPATVLRRRAAAGCRGRGAGPPTRRATRAQVCALPEGAAGELLVLPLYAALPPELQLRVFRPPQPGVRRCIVATNVAETSITVDGVVYVVDSGAMKLKTYNPGSGMDSLDVTPISRVQAAQRAGRAGRTRPGKCYRLYSRRYFERTMPDATPPEICRTALAGAVLQLKALGLPGLDVLSFDFLDPPEQAALAEALRQLYVLDALDVDGAITATGRTMAGLPLEPGLARALIEGHRLGCLEEVITVAAMLSAEHIFAAGHGPEGAAPGNGLARSGGGGAAPDAGAKLKALAAECQGDHLLLLRLYQLWAADGFGRDFVRATGLDLRGMNFARDIRKQLAAVANFGSSADRQQPGTSGSGRDGAEQQQQQPDVGGDRKRRRWEDERPGSSGGPAALGRPPSRGGRGASPPDVVERVRRALTVGFGNRVARRMRLHNGYRTVNERGALAQVHPGSSQLSLDGDGLMPEWLIYHEFVATSRPFLRQVCPTRFEWVEPLLPKLQGVDVQRLSGGKLRAEAAAAAAAAVAAAAAAADDAGGGGGAQAAQLARRNDDDAVSAARARFLARKAAAAGAGGGGGKKRG